MRPNPQHLHALQLVRHTLCFSKTERRHDRVLGLCITRSEFERLICTMINTGETPPSLHVLS